MTWGSQLSVSEWYAVNEVVNLKSQVTNLKSRLSVQAGSGVDRKFMEHFSCVVVVVDVTANRGNAVGHYNVFCTDRRVIHRHLLYHHRTHLSMRRLAFNDHPGIS